MDGLGIGRSKYYEWRRRYGKVNEHNAWIPRDHWLEDWEKEGIITYCLDHPGEGYRRLTYMMMDEDIVAVSPSSVYRVLKGAGLLGRWNRAPSKKGTGFQQPLKPHEHWHTDISYINIRGTFYYLCSVLDGFSRYIVHWEIRESMTEADVEIVLQRAREAGTRQRGTARFRTPPSTVSCVRPGPGLPRRLERRPGTRKRNGCHRSPRHRVLTALWVQSSGVLHCHWSARFLASHAGQHRR